MKTQKEELKKHLYNIETKKQELIEEQNKTIEMFNDEIKMVKQIINSEEGISLKAANAWCRITNALIAKYKTMTEENPQKAFEQLIRIEGLLLAGQFITQEELDNAL